MNQEEIMQQLQVAVQAYRGKDLDSAEAIFKQILTVNPKEPNALHLLGCIYKDRGQLQQAVELIQASIQVDGSNPIPFLNLGKILAIAGQHENAAGVFQESLKRSQQIPETWFCLGIAFEKVGKMQEAMQSYRKVLSLDPTHQDCALRLEQLLFRESNWAELRSLLEDRLRNEPNNFSLRANYGSVLVNLGDLMAAVKQLSIAESQSPESAEISYNLANARKEFGEFIGEAIAGYRKAIELKPDFVNAYLNLGNVLVENGDIEDAIAGYRKAIELKPDLANAYKNLATLLHQENELDDALTLYVSAFEIDDQMSDCRFHLCAAGVENLAHGFVALQSELERLSQCSGNLLQEDLLLLRCLFDFSVHRGMPFELPSELDQDFSSETFSPIYSAALDDLFEKYSLCRKSSLPRWLAFEDNSKRLLLLSDYLESLRLKGAFSAEVWKTLKAYQLSMASVYDECLSAQDKSFVRVKDHDEDLWLKAERFQFPETPAARLLEEFPLGKDTPSVVFKSDQSEFFRKAHLLDAQKFYMADEDSCLHGVSELYRVHGLIADTIREMDGLQGVVDLGYYSCGIFNAGLKVDLKRYCIEPARHHAVWAAESGIAEVVPDVPKRCVRSFEEYLSRLDAVALDDPGSTAAVISFILQMWKHKQCVELLQRVKGFASQLVITDDILNEESDQSLLRLLSGFKPLYFAHSYKRLLSDAGWEIEKKWYFHGVRYASGIIVASAA